MPRSSAALFVLAARASGTTLQALGEKLGVARRTAQRWVQRGPDAVSMRKLPAIVHPHDPALAAEIAEAVGTTLEALGVVPPPPPPPAPVPPPPPPPVPAGVVDAVVCAAAEALDMAPRDVRPGLLAAFTRAAEVGLDVARVAEVLREQASRRGPEPA